MRAACSGPRIGAAVCRTRVQASFPWDASGGTRTSAATPVPASAPSSRCVGCWCSSAPSCCSRPLLLRDRAAAALVRREPSPDEEPGRPPFRVLRSRHPARVAARGVGRRQSRHAADAAARPGAHGRLEHRVRRRHIVPRPRGGASHPGRRRRRGVGGVPGLARRGLPPRAPRSTHRDDAGRGHRRRDGRPTARGCRREAGAEAGVPGGGRRGSRAGRCGGPHGDARRRPADG